MFKKVLIANRGEIAIRVLRTLRAMGIDSVGVYSEADALAPHASEANEAYCIGPAEAAASYLNQEKLLEIARQSGCDAVHPGYGFLSENADFARKSERAGLVFIGPRPEALEEMASKVRARALMQQAKVPVVPGSAGNCESVADLKCAAEKMQLPVLIKASAGGGGKGMRIVYDLDEFERSATLARDEAEKAFGDGTLFVEKYLERSRHIEIQIFADNFGNTIHLFERECSIQRRHQKIIEEAPSVAIDEKLTQRLGKAAVAAAKAVDYRGAGTVEFLLDDQGDFYFLEMNTRLQVEHAVTEEICGLDLVRMQLEVAAGQPLPEAALNAQRQGHAMECRVYAEDPASGFLPASGRIECVRLPQGPGVRVDAALYDGMEVSIYYDPMLAKVVTHGRDRAECMARMKQALSEFVVLGIQTNLEFLQAVLSHETFVQGDLSTHFIEDHMQGWQSQDKGLPPEALAALFLADSTRTQQHSRGHQIIPSPWQTLNGWQFGNVTAKAGAQNERS